MSDSRRSIPFPPSPLRPVWRAAAAAPPPPPETAAGAPPPDDQPPAGSTVEAVARRMMSLHAGTGPRRDVAPPPPVTIDIEPDPEPAQQEVRLQSAVVRFNTARSGLVIRPGAPKASAEATLRARRAEPSRVPYESVSAPAPALAPEPAPIAVEPEPEDDVEPQMAAVAAPPAARAMPAPRPAEPPTQSRAPSVSGLAGRGQEAFDREDYPAAFQAWSAAAAAGDAEAQYRLGHLYTRGLGVIQNLPDAMVWY